MNWPDCGCSEWGKHAQSLHIPPESLPGVGGQRGKRGTVSGVTHLTCSRVGGPGLFHIGTVQNFSEVSVHLCHLLPMFTLLLLLLLLMFSLLLLLLLLLKI